MDTKELSIIAPADPDLGSSDLSERDATFLEPGGSEAAPVDPRLLAMIHAGRHHGMELNPAEFRPMTGDTAPSATALSLWAQNAGLWSRAVRIRWRHLLRLQDSAPVVLLLKDGSAALADRREPRAAWSSSSTDPSAPAECGAGGGRRAAAVGGLGGRGRAAARRPRPCRDRCAVQPALARRSGAAGAPSRCAISRLPRSPSAS